MDRSWIVTLCGFYSLGFAVFHAFFWRIFHWKKELPALGPANRAIVQILNLRLIYVFAFMALLCFVYPKPLLETSLGQAILAGSSLFWLGRAIEQYIFLRRIRHWMVTLLTVLFWLGAVLFALPLLAKT